MNCPNVKSEQMPLLAVFDLAFDKRSPVETNRLEKNAKTEEILGGIKLRLFCHIQIIWWILEDYFISIASFRGT